MPKSQLISRREALSRTILFSTGLMASGWLRSGRAAEPATGFSKEGAHFFALGDFGTGNANQAAVSQQMSAFAQKLGQPLTAVLALGDNFYGKLEPARFKPHFEEMYSREHLNCPFYACLGNHDYGPLYDSRQGRAKTQIQLDYAAANPSSRWKMPGRWYSVELPDAENPLVKIIFLDGNMSDWGLTPREKVDQRRFLTAELQKKTKAPWRWLISHYPLYTETSKRKDNERLIKEWADEIEAHDISLYLSGHDHNLQHLKVEGHKTSFIVSGAGGAGLYEVNQTERGYAQKILGFTHLHVDREATTVQYIDSHGQCLHSFRKLPNGKSETRTA